MSASWACLSWIRQLCPLDVVLVQGDYVQCHNQRLREVRAVAARPRVAERAGPGSGSASFSERELRCTMHFLLLKNPNFKLQIISCEMPSRGTQGEQPCFNAVDSPIAGHTQDWDLRTRLKPKERVPPHSGACWTDMFNTRGGVAEGPCYFLNAPHHGNSSAASQAGLPRTTIACNAAISACGRGASAVRRRTATGISLRDPSSDASRAFPSGYNDMRPGS